LSRLNPEADNDGFREELIVLWLLNIKIKMSLECKLRMDFDRTHSLSVNLVAVLVVGQYNISSSEIGTYGVKKVSWLSSSLSSYLTDL
jgi:hypothetical protein